MFKSLFYVFISAVLIGCKSNTENVITSIHQGLDSYKIFKIHKKDSLSYIPPPLPVFHQNITSNNIIEAPNGDFYYYSFSVKDNLCGLINNKNVVPEYYYADFTKLTSENLQKLDNRSLAIITKSILTSNKYIELSIGIQNNCSNNPLVLYIINLLQTNYNSAWKVRALLPGEQHLLEYIK